MRQLTLNSEQRQPIEPIEPERGQLSTIRQISTTHQILESACRACPSSWKRPSARASTSDITGTSKNTFTDNSSKRHGMGLCKQFLKFVHLLFGHFFVRVSLNGVFTDSFVLGRSIKQGCPLSPLLYAIAFDSLGWLIKHYMNPHQTGLSPFPSIVCYSF